MIPEQSGQFGV